MPVTWYAVPVTLKCISPKEEMATPELTSNIFMNRSHLALSVPHKTAIRKVATGTTIHMSVVDRLGFKNKTKILSNQGE